VTWRQPPGEGSFEDNARRMRHHWIRQCGPFIAPGQDGSCLTSRTH
jgi:hypothetical protein